MKKITLTLGFALFIVTMNAQQPQMNALMPFVENNGQVIGTEGNLHPELLYYTDVNGLRAYFSPSRISHVWQRRDTITNQDTLYRMDVAFQGYNPGVQVQVTSSDSMPGRLNYFLGYLPSQVTGVRMWNKIVYHNLYPNSDLIFTNTGTSLNYRFDLAQNANLSDIKIKFLGATNVQVTANGKLIITTPYGTIEYDKPKGRKIVGNSNVTTPVNMNFHWNGTVLTLSANANINGVRLLVDVERIIPVLPTLPVINQEIFWSTYFGNSAGNEMHDNYIDASNNLYIAGGSAAGAYPFVNSLSLLWAGSWDGVVAKFNPDRSLKFGTWIGGSGWDEAWAITEDAAGNVCFSGPTAGSGFPLVSPVQSTISGQGGFYTKIDGNLGQTILISTFLGYNIFNNGGFAIAADALGNVYVGTSSRGTDPSVPVLSLTNAYNQPTNGGSSTNLNGFIAKFNASNAQVWGTYLGGSGTDVITTMTTDINNNLYVIGWSQSPTTTAQLCGTPCASNSNPGFFPIADPQNGVAYQQQQAGNRDAFVAKFDVNDALIWSTMYGGGGDDGLGEGHGNGIVVDANGAIYIVSTTGSNSVSGDIPIRPITQPSDPFIYWQNISGGGADIFVAKFDPSYDLIYSTYYGGNGADLGSDIAVGHALGATQVYLSGSTSSSASTFYTYALGNFYYLPANGPSKRGYIITLEDDPSNSSGLPSLFWSSCLDVLDTWFVSALNNHLVAGGWTGSNLQPAPIQPTPSAYFQGTPPCNCYNGFITEFILHSCFYCPNARTMNTENNLTSISEVNTFPNPTNGIFNIIIPKEYEAAEITIYVYDALGKEVYLKKPIGNSIGTVDISDQPEGLYLVKVSGGNATYMTKIIYQK